MFFSFCFFVSFQYFRDYKSFSGKINTYALRAQAMPRHYALKVIEETHHHWRSLHLVKKRDIIGESVTQLGTRAVGSNNTNSSPPVPSAELPQLSQALLAASQSPRITHVQAPAAPPVLSNPQPAAVQVPAQSPPRGNNHNGASSSSSSMVSSGGGVASVSPSTASAQHQSVAAGSGIIPSSGMDGPVDRLLAAGGK
jgi:hypothetical protein